MELADKKLPLNEDQEIAAKGFFEFLFSDEKEMRISGPGGVGKTYLMGHMIDTLMQHYFDSCRLAGIEPEYWDVYMTATTNKAAEVLGLNTGRPASTVHSFLGLKVKDDYSTGKSSIEKTGAWRVHQNIILFVDEASMVDRALLAAIREGTCKSKIVYVGDRSQLAPVHETVSQVYTDSMPSFELLKPMRNAGQPALQTICAQFRKTVDDHIFRPIQLVPGVIDHLDDNQMEQEITQNFVDPNFDGRILTYTNKRAIMYNQFIREIRGLPEQFQEGERLVNNTAIRIGKIQLSVEDEVQIIELSNTTAQHEIQEGVHLEVRFATLENKYGDRLYGVMLPVDRDHYDRLVKYYQKVKNWNRYYYLKNNFPDLRQRDACTSYKAQGSTMQTAYIDLTDFSTCKNPAQAARLAYVNVSRPTTRIVFYGELAPRFGELIQ
ncbi:exonuclease V subunit alpha [compost metagenome]